MEKLMKAKDMCFDTMPVSSRKNSSVHCCRLPIGHRSQHICDFRNRDGTKCNFKWKKHVKRYIFRYKIGKSTWFCYGKNVSMSGAIKWFSEKYGVAKLISVEVAKKKSTICTHSYTRTGGGGEA